MTTKKTDTSTEREGTPETDPALVAAKEAQEAAAAWSAYAKAHPTRDDEQTPEYKAVQERSEKADDIFADAPVTSAAGALAKMQELRALVMHLDPEEDGLDARHFNTVTAFLEAVAGAPSVVDDPTVAAFAELKEASVALDAFPDEAAYAETPECEAAYRRFADARDAVHNAAPTSLAGVAAKVRTLLEYRAEGDELAPTYEHVAKTMLPFLEGAPAALPTVTEPDPVVARLPSGEPSKTR